VFAAVRITSITRLGLESIVTRDARLSGGQGRVAVATWPAPQATGASGAGYDVTTESGEAIQRSFAR
jgi:hypothetical protein